jgi:hypothetical protein
MSEARRDENTSTPVVKWPRREIRWDAAAAIIASLVGLLALVVAGYTAYIQRQQVSAQVWPYLIGGNSGNNTELVWMNKGVGPAIVKSVEVTIGGQPQRDWKMVLDTLGIRSAAYHQSFLNGNVVSPGETIHWIRFAQRRDYDEFMHLEQRPDFRVTICYCSTLGDCWRTGFGAAPRQPVDRCPAVPESRQFHD